MTTPDNRRGVAPRPSRRCRAWRVNGAAFELIPIGLAQARTRRGAGDPCELRRKADDRRLALLWWRGRGDRSAVVLQPLRGLDRAARAALCALVLPWIARTSPRGRIVVSVRGATRRGRIGVDRTLRASARLRSRGHVAQPLLNPIALPVAYGQRTQLSRQTEPVGLVLAGIDAFGRAAWLRDDAARAWTRMRHAARADGIALELVSGFRHAAYQTRLFQRKFARGLSMDDVLRVNAAPGYSEHHTGRAIDITAPGSPPAEEAFESTPAFAWLDRHAQRFRFRLSYPRGNPHGVVYEPWHWLYVPEPP